MHAVTVRPHRLDRAHRDLHPDLQLPLRAGGPQLRDHFVRHRDAGQVRVQELSHLGGTQQQNAGQHLHLELAHRPHEGHELVRMVDGLGLKKLGPRVHLGLELHQHRADRVRFGGHRRADQKVCHAVELIAGQIPAVVQPLDQLHDLH